MRNLKIQLKKKTGSYKRRKFRVNSVIKANSENPRVIIQKSNMYVSAQLIDNTGKVLGHFSDKGAKGDTKTNRAQSAGLEFGKKILSQKIEKISFDRNGNLYHGRIKAFAEGLREAGLKF
ncbi:50S ribosomal protein L18 [Candidatus Gracilibacteria bacterium]|nr:50S ribosomal protein L18 [Candidatus Gracilibacteria bacterium]